MKYRMKPIEVEAMQWDGSGESANQLRDWAGDKVERISGGGLEYVVFVTNEYGTTRLQPGDWVVKGAGENVHGCPDSVFKDTYEPVQ